MVVAGTVPAAHNVYMRVSLDLPHHIEKDGQGSAMDALFTAMVRCKENIAVTKKLMVTVIVV